VSISNTYISLHTSHCENTINTFIFNIVRYVSNGLSVSQNLIYEGNCSYLHISCSQRFFHKIWLHGRSLYERSRDFRLFTLTFTKASTLHFMNCSKAATTLVSSITKDYLLPSRKQYTGMYEA